MDLSIRYLCPTFKISVIFRRGYCFLKNLQEWPLFKIFSYNCILFDEHQWGTLNKLSQNFKFLFDKPWSAVLLTDNVDVANADNTMTTMTLTTTDNS